MRVDVQEVLVRLEEQIRDNEALLAQLQPLGEGERARQGEVVRGCKLLDQSPARSVRSGCWFV